MADNALSNPNQLESEMTADQILTRAMLKLRVIRPFYSALYESMEKKEDPSIETIGVGTNYIVYNAEFLKSLPFEEFMFINLHEVAHVALMHVARRQNRDRKLWNIACDIIVNETLLREFSLTVGESVKISGVEIKAPEDGQYCASIDLDTDYVEKIYESFEEQAKHNGYSGAPESGGDGSSGKEYHFEYRGNKEADSGSYMGRGKIDRPHVFKTNIKKTSGDDLIDSGGDQSEKEQQSRKILSDAVVRSEMQSNQAGTSPGLMERMVNELLKSKLDWKKVLNKYLIAATSSDSSFSRPDKRMYYQKSIYPGRTMDESNKIEGIKVCIDTSGSISEQDLAEFKGHIAKLIKQFKVDAELIYWDASIESAGNFSSLKDVERVECLGGGGTNPAVVFEYFLDKQIKPTVTVMLTDGYFPKDWDTGTMRRRFKDTIWVMTEGGDPDFEAPFGKKAFVKFNQ